VNGRRLNRARLGCAAALALLLTSGTALAADKAKPSPEESAYQQERARCLRGQSQQDRATCLKEAGAAFDEARRGRLGKAAAAADLSANATRRCEAQPAAERDACVQRILGAGSAQGSVEGGGLIRQTETPAR
jgi:hypothetical protein